MSYSELAMGEIQYCRLHWLLQPENSRHWVDTGCLSLQNLHTHDPKELTRDLKLSTEWQVVDRRIPLYANHKTILQKVASLFGAHF